MTLNEAAQHKLAEFVAAGRQIADHDLVRCSSGNLSCRIDDDLIALTPRAGWLGRLDADQIALCRLTDGACINGKMPSVEAGFHSGVLAARPDVNVVLHYQSPYATTISCQTTIPNNFSVIPEVPFYVGTPVLIEYDAPGSGQLAAKVIAALKEHDLVMLTNHGQVVVGRDFTDVIQKAVFFELACQIIVLGRDVRTMSDADGDDLRRRAQRERSAKSDASVKS